MLPQSIIFILGQNLEEKKKKKKKKKRFRIVSNEFEFANVV